MECVKCGKDMEPPPGMPTLGLVLGVKVEDFACLPTPEHLAQYTEYLNKQFGKYKPVASGICCECILDSLLNRS